MRVKVIDCENEVDLENKINSFLEKKEVIDIKFQVVAFQSHGEQIYCFSALIMYI